MTTSRSADGTAEPQRVGVRELRGDLTHYLQQVREGATVLVTSRDQVIAELRPLASALRPRRRPGAMRGRIKLAEDFDMPPADVLAAMEGEGE